jgi:hypothetical protein
MRRMLVAALLLAQQPTSVGHATDCVVWRGTEVVLRYECPDGPTEASAREALVEEVLRLRGQVCQWYDSTVTTPAGGLQLRH